MYESQSIHYALEYNRQAARFFESKFIKQMLEFGGMIAGGAARQLYLKKDLKEYLLTSSYKKGDIDIFFLDNFQFEKAIAWAEAFAKQKVMVAGYVEESATFETRSYIGLVANVEANFNLGFKCYNWQTQKIQLIKPRADHKRYEDVLEEFDITNAKIGYTANFLLKHKDFDKLEAIKTLNIDNFGEYTIPRVKRYAELRGIDYLTEKTRESILNKALCSDYHGSLQDLLNIKELFTDDEVLYFIGRFQLSDGGDFALKLLENRKQLRLLKESMVDGNEPNVFKRFKLKFRLS